MKHLFQKVEIFITIMEKPDINKRLEKLINTTVGGNVTEFARRCNIPHSQTLSNMINKNSKGKYSMPSAPTLALIAEHMPDVDMHWLLTGKEKIMNELSEPGATYKKEITGADYLSLSKRMDLAIQQNNEIIERLDRAFAKQLIDSEKNQTKSNNKKQF